MDESSRCKIRFPVPAALHGCEIVSLRVLRPLYCQPPYRACVERSFVYCVRAESGERGRDDENLDAIVVPTSDRLPLMDRHVLVSRLGPRHATRRHRLVSVGAAMGNTAVSVSGLPWATPPCQCRGCHGQHRCVSVGAVMGNTAVSIGAAVVRS